MEAFLVFDPQNNLISIKHNKLFSDYLVHSANQSGLEIEDETLAQDINNNENLKNLLSVLLTPYVASQRYLVDRDEIIFDCITNSKAVSSKVSKI